MSKIVIDIDDNDPTKMVIREFPWAMKPLVQILPTAKYRKDKFYLNLTWPVALAVKNDLKNAFEPTDRLKEWMGNYYTERILKAYNLRELLEMESEDPVDEGLYPHQKVDVRFLATAERAILSNGMGSGKSRSSISALKHLQNQGNDVFPAIVVGPSATKGTWKKEFHAIWPEAKVLVIDGTATKRRKLFKQFEDEEYDVLIMNWESLKGHSRLASYGSIALKKCPECGGSDPKVKSTSCEVHLKELNHIDFNSIIGDEFHRAKDPKSKQTRALRGATGDARFRFALTGTPIANEPSELFSTLNWLYPDAYPGRTAFLDRFFDTKKNFFDQLIIEGVNPHMTTEFFQGIDPILRRVPTKAVIHFLPPLVRTTRVVEMTAKQAKAYKDMSEQMIAQLEGETEDGVVFAVDPLAKMIRLIQFASAYGQMVEKEVRDPDSPFPDQTKTKEFLELTDPSSKLDTFMEDLVEYNLEEESLVVFAQSKQLLDLLAERLDKKEIKYGKIVGGQDGVERQSHMDSFQEGKLPLILVSLQAGGTGVTLTRARHMVFLQRSWSMVDNMQAEARAYRIGSEIHSSVNIVDYTTVGTIEEMINQAIEKKADNLEFILRDKDLLKKVIKNEEIEFPKEGETDE